MRTIKTILLAVIFACINLQTATAQKTEQNGWYVKDYTESTARAYLTGNAYLDYVEGIWQSSDGYVYAIEKNVENSRRESDRYRVIVLSSSYDGWKQGEIKGFITHGSTEGMYSMKYYTKYGNGSGLSSQNVFLFAKSPLLMSFNRIDENQEVMLVKVFPKETEDRTSQQQGNPTSALEQWSGSGIAIGDRYIATNNHVVEDAKTLVIQVPSVSKTAEYNVEVVATDKYNDLAILKVTDYKFNGFGNLPYGSKLNTSDLGEEVFVLGYPLVQTMGEDVKLTTGVVSAKTGFQGDVSQYQISAAVQPGNSGGPLFDYRGNLIGIVSAKHKGAENVGYAIKLNYLNNLAETTSERIVFPRNNTISTMSLAEKVKTITKFVVLIKANTSGASSQSSSRDGQRHSTNVSASDKADAERLYESCVSKIQSQQPDVKGAYRDICRSVELYPTVQSNKIKAYIAAAYIMDWESALEASKYCVDNGDDSNRNIYAMSLQNLKRYEEAIIQYTELIKKDRRDVWSLYGRACCHEMLSHWTEVIEDCKALLAFEKIVDFDRYASAYNELAWAYLNIGKVEDAIKPIAQSIKLDHTISNSWDTDGEVKYKTNDFTGCIRSMTFAITIAKLNQREDSRDNSYYYRGLARKALGQMADAYKDLEKAVEYGNEEAKKALAEIDASKIDFSETTSFSRMVQSPTVKKNKSASQILGVEMTSDFTALYCSYTNKKYEVGGWYSIDPNAYLRDKATGKKYICIATENCDFLPQQTSIEKGETKRFVLYFEALPESTQEIDFFEGDQSSWQLYGISLK